MSHKLLILASSHQHPAQMVAEEALVAVGLRFQNGHVQAVGDHLLQPPPHQIGMPAHQPA